MSLETAEENTKIRRKYLEALEQENYDILPGRVYVKGFLKNYASFLGLNANELVSAYGERAPESEREDDGNGDKLTHIEKPPKTSYYKIVLGLVAIAAAIYIAVPALTGMDRGAGKSVPGGKENRNLMESKALKENSPTPEQGQNKAGQEAKSPVQKGVNLTLNVTDNTSWMYVEIDGSPAYEGTMASGQVKEFKGTEKIYLRLGNAGVVEVEYNGQKMGVLGQRGKVVNREFTAPQV
ncbi:MAG: DUF4115 domain-containing protein [Actinobacteria bacterium]|nr:DUF4115 domain-containing protein [Actinomycetota bacterium]